MRALICFTLRALLCFEILQGTLLISRSSTSIDFGSPALVRREPSGSSALQWSSGALMGWGTLIEAPLLNL